MDYFAHEQQGGNFPQRYPNPSAGGYHTTAHHSNNTNNNNVMGPSRAGDDGLVSNSIVHTSSVTPAHTTDSLNQMQRQYYQHQGGGNIYDRRASGPSNHQVGGEASAATAAAPTSSGGMYMGSSSSGGPLGMGRAANSTGPQSQSPNHYYPHPHTTSTSNPNSQAMKSSGSYYFADDFHVNGAISTVATGGSNTNNANNTTNPNGGPVTLFDAEVPVHVRHLDREEVYQPLGVCVSVGRGGPTGVSKCVSVRLTDPKDPFFLFSMTLLEDDYGRFKEKHELMVDFNGFPRDLVHMLCGIGGARGAEASSSSMVGGGGSPMGGGATNNGNIVTFVADSKDSGVLRILEKTEFRALEHIALTMSRQGDVGQKKYLAEKFQHYLAAFTRSEHERREETVGYERLLASLRDELRKLTVERDQLLERTKTEASVAASSQLSAIADLKDQHMIEVKQMQAASDDAKATLNRKIDVLMAQHSADMKAKDEEVSRMRTNLSSAETSNTTLSSQLRLANDTVATLTSEVEHLRKENESLTAFRQKATVQLNEKELAHVANTERVRHLSDTLKSREEDIKSLREAQGSQDGYAKMLADQLSSLQEKVRVTEASLSKAHHILGTQVQALRSAKDKHAALKGQIEANETLLGEKNNLIERLRGDLLNSGDKVENLQGKVTDLNEKLIKAEENVAKLTTQLKQNEDALVHMQRMSSGFGARTFGAGGVTSMSPPSSLLASTHGSGIKLGATGGFSGVSGFGTADLYKQFAAGLTTGLGSAAAQSPASAAAGDATSGSRGGSPSLSNAPLSGSDAATPSASSAAAAGASTIGVNNQLLTGYNSIASGSAVLSNPNNPLLGGAQQPQYRGSTYPYTSNSPPTMRSTTLHGSGASATVSHVASSVSYLPPKSVVGSSGYSNEKPSSYFGN